MTLRQVIRALCGIAKAQPNIRYTREGSIYESLNANPSIDYNAFVITQQRHWSTERYDNYSFYLFFVGRLTDDLEDNRVQMQSLGMQQLDNIIRSFCEEYDIDYPSRVEYTTFEERFQDLTAGAYANVTFEIPIDYICADFYEDEEG